MKNILNLFLTYLIFILLYFLTFLNIIFKQKKYIIKEKKIETNTL